MDTEIEELVEVKKEFKIKPIGCSLFHYTRQVGDKLVCFYCGEEIKSK